MCSPVRHPVAVPRQHGVGSGIQGLGLRGIQAGPMRGRPNISGVEALTLGSSPRSGCRPRETAPAKPRSMPDARISENVRSSVAFGEGGGERRRRGSREKRDNWRRLDGSFGKSNDFLLEVGWAQQRGPDDGRNPRAWAAQGRGAQLRPGRGAQLLPGCCYF